MLLRLLILCLIAMKHSSSSLAISARILEKSFIYKLVYKLYVHPFFILCIHISSFNSSLEEGSRYLSTYMRVLNCSVLSLIFCLMCSVNIS
jgi:hypothetical protein